MAKKDEKNSQSSRTDQVSTESTRDGYITYVSYNEVRDGLSTIESGMGTLGKLLGFNTILTGILHLKFFTQCIFSVVIFRQKCTVGKISF